MLHPGGAVFFTDPPFGLLNIFNSPDREMDYTGVFRLGPDNSVSLVDNIAAQRNGFHRMDQGLRHGFPGWVVFDVDAKGNTSNRRGLVPNSVVSGGDGLKIDHLGNMYWSQTGSRFSIRRASGLAISRPTTAFPTASSGRTGTST